MINNLKRRIEIIDERIENIKTRQIEYPECKLALELSLTNLECIKEELEYELFIEKSKRIINGEYYGD